jgi:hypothetical protein
MGTIYFRVSPQGLLAKEICKNHQPTRTFATSTSVYQIEGLLLQAVLQTPNRRPSRRLLLEFNYPEKFSRGAKSSAFSFQLSAFG